MDKNTFSKAVALGLAVLCVVLVGCSKKPKTVNSETLDENHLQPVEKVIMSGSYGYIDKGGYAMLAYNGDIEAENIDIPSSIDGLPVRELKEYLFANCEKLKTVTIPDGVQEIGKYVFVECDKLEIIRIPEGVKSVNEGLFKYCKSLKTVELPQSLTHIEDYAFAGCGAMEYIYIPESVKFIGTHAFSGCNPNLQSNKELNIVQNTYYGITGTFPECEEWTKNIIMYDDNEDGVFTVVVNDLEPGVYEFKVRANGEWTDSWGSLNKGETYNSQENCTVIVEKRGSVEIDFDTSGEDSKLWNVYSKIL
jgi:hypothetical protein